MKIYKIHQSYSDSYTNHQLVKELFPGEGRVLFQVNGPKITVLTETDLDPKFADEPGIEYIGDSDNYLSNIDSDVGIPFSIRLNGCKTVKHKRKSLPKEEIDEWVNVRLSDIGIDVVDKKIIDEGVNITYRQKEKMYHASLLVQGLLKINDLNLFKDVLFNGIGHGKMLGFGLVNIFHC